MGAYTRCGAIKMNTLDYAIRYLALGASVVPLQPRKKRPFPNFSLERYFSQRMTGTELKQWLKDPQNNIGIITGEVSNLLAVDSDGDAVGRFERKLAELPYGNLHTTLTNTFMQKTGSGGYHFLFRVEYAGDNRTQIAAIVRNNVIWRDGEGRHSEIRFKYNHGYIVAAPSVHPNGTPYQWNGKEPHLITVRELEQFIAIFGATGKQTVLFTADTPEAKDEPPVTNFVPTNGMTPAYTKAVLDMIIPKYKEGQRNEIVLYLAGGFYKAGFRQDQAERVITMLCRMTGDGELYARLDTVKRTYAKPVNKVKGFSGLESVI